MSLIVTGSIGIDSVETPRGTAEDVLGGSSVYFAAAASLFGAVRLVGAVGDDFPAHLRQMLEHFPVDLTGLEERVGSKTFRWRGRYHANMNKRDTVDVQLNVLAEGLPPIPDLYRDSRYVFLANTHPGAQLELRANFPTANLVFADTMDLWIETERSLLLDLLRNLDGLVLNDSEAQQLTNKSNLVHAAEQIARWGPKTVVVKKGEHGALIHHSEGNVALPAYPSPEVVDPTGAGDSFAGGMMGYLSANEDHSLASMRRATAYGTIVASFNIESFSLDRLMHLSRSELDERFASFRAMLEI